MTLRLLFYFVSSMLIILELPSDDSDPANPNFLEPSNEFPFPIHSKDDFNLKYSTGILKTTDLQELRHCMINYGVRSDNEFSLSISEHTSSMTDGENVDVVFKHQLAVASNDKNSPYKNNEIKNDQLENLRGFRQLFIDYYSEKENEINENQKHLFKKGEVIAGIEAPHRYIPMCPAEYTCEKYRGYVDKRGKETPNKLHGIDFYDGTFFKPYNYSVKENPFFGDTPGETVQEFVSSLECTNSTTCTSTICTRQSLDGLSNNYNIPKSKLREIWGELTSEKTSRYTDKTYCQPRRICIRKPTGKNEKLESGDSYCTDGLKNLGDGYCVDTNEIILNNIDTYPDVEVNKNAGAGCKIKWTEKYIDTGAEVGSASGAGFCTIAGYITRSECEKEGGTWTEVSVKYSTLARHMMGLEWLWSQADLDNVMDKVDLHGETEDYLLLSQDLHELGKRLKDYRTSIHLDRIIKLDESVREAFRNIKDNESSSSENQGVDNSGVDDQLQQIQINFIEKMKENSESEAGMWLTLLGASGLKHKVKNNEYDSLINDNFPDNELSFSRLKDLNKKTSPKMWDRDKKKREYLWDNSEGGASDLSCKGQINSQNDDPEDELESCSLYHDAGYCDFHISNRNCVQDSVYIISDDHFWGTKANNGAENYLNIPMTEKEKTDRGRTRNHIHNSRLKKNVEYETSCFFLNGDETRFLGLDDEDHDDNSGDDDDLEDKCDNEPDEYEFVLSKHFHEEFGYRSNGKDIDKDDEIEGISYAHIGHFVRTPNFGNILNDNKPKDGIRDIKKDGIGPSASYEIEKELENRVYGVKQQGGLVNPVIPLSILSGKNNFRPSDDDNEGSYNVPRVGNWWFMEESEFKTKIKEEFNKYINKEDDQAKACGKNLKINNTSLTVEEFLYHERMKDPKFSIDDARRRFVNDGEEVKEILLNNSSDQIYESILGLHFSHFNPYHGTFSLLSNTQEGLSYCPDESDRGDFISPDLKFDRCKANTGAMSSGRPLGSEIENIESVIFWLALYKIAEAKMFGEMYECLDSNSKDIELAMGYGGLEDEVELKKLRNESVNNLKKSSSLKQCLEGNTEDEIDQGGNDRGGRNGGLNNSANTSTFSNLELFQQTLNGIGDMGSIRETNSKSTNTKSLLDAGTGGATSTTDVGSLSGNLASGGVGESSTGSVNSGGPGSFAKRINKIQKDLIKVAKEINKRNKEVEDIFKEAGAPPPRKVNSDGVFATKLASSAGRLASLGNNSLPTSIGGEKKKNNSLRSIGVNKDNALLSPSTSKKTYKLKKTKKSKSRKKKKVTKTEAKNNKRILDFINKNKNKYKTEDKDSIFERITKATVRVAYPIFLEVDFFEGGEAGSLPSFKNQKSMELTPAQKAAAKEMELLKGLRKKGKK